MFIPFRNPLLKIVTLFSFCLVLPVWAQDQEVARVDNWTEGVEVDFKEGQTEANKEKSSIAQISSEIQSLKKEVIGLNKELRLLEENMLFPSNTRFTIFVTINSGKFFQLESIKVKIDGRFVATHIYSEKQRLALLNGGVQKLYMTNLSEGKHRVTVFYTGLGFNGRAYKRAANLELEKGPGSQYLELLITDDETTQEPAFKLNQW